MNIISRKLNIAFVSVFALILSNLQGQGLQQSASSDADAENEEDELVMLSPFEVSGENSQRYLATSTLAGTRVRTDLADLGASISVSTKEFLKDTQSNDSQDLLVYTLNTEVGGVTGNFGGMGNGSSLFERGTFVTPNSNTRIRGLASADNTRNYYNSRVPWDSYNTSAITISRGANSVLFGLGSPAGIINNSTDQATFNNAYELEWTMDENGSQRVAVDANQVILPDELAVRVEALYNKKEYDQDPAYSEDKRFYGALKYDPKFLDRDGMHTSLRVTFEQGSIRSNNPRVLPPVDKITPWFNDMGKVTIDNFNPPTLAEQPWLAPEGLTGGPRVVFSDPTSQVRSPNYAVEMVPTQFYGLGPDGSVDNSIAGLGMDGRTDGLRLERIGAYWNYSRNAGLPFSTTLNPYKDISLTDSSIFDFYDLLLDGPNKGEKSDFDVTTIDLTQTFWENRIALQASWALENYDDGFYGILGWGGPGDTSVSVDINQYMPDGSPNPNVGRPMIESHSGGGTVNFSERTNSRYSAFAELSASDVLPESWITNVLGRHKFTGAYTTDDYRNEMVTFNRTAMDSSYRLITGGTGQTANGIPQAGFINYIGSDISGAGTASGLHLPNISVVQPLAASQTRYWDSSWAWPVNPDNPDYVNPADPWMGYDGEMSTQSENPANYGGWTVGDTGVLVSDYNNYKETAVAAEKTRLDVESYVFVWQGFFFDDVVVPTWSVRKDKVKTYTSTAPRNPDGTRDVDSPDFVLGDTPRAEDESTIHSFSLVVHTPRAIRERLWGKTDLALFYNDSSNFQVLPGRVDLYGNPVPNPSGTTEEYGVMLTTWNNRLRLKVSKYETALENATLPGAYNEFVLGLSSYLIYTNSKRLELGLSGDPDYSVENSGYAYNLQPFPDVSEAETLAIQQEMVTAGLASVDDDFFEAWNIDKNDSSGWLLGRFDGFQAPSGIKATSNSVSEGWEVELDFQPNPNWTISANVAKTEARFTEVAGNFVDYVNHIQSTFEGPVGEMGYAYVYSDPGVFWGRGAPVAHPALWNQFFYAPWKLLTAQEGTNLAEIRPWRFNVITNYKFSGKLKEWNIGGAWRWQDRVGIGYPVYHDTATDADTFDVENPYWGPQEGHVDLWVGYERALTDRLHWRIQVNVRNVGESASLIPISTQADGSAATMRISEGQSFRVTNTFSF